MQEDMLKTIIAMDEKARQLKAAAQEEKVNIEKQIDITAVQIHDEYIENAKQEVKAILAKEKSDMEKKCAATDAKNEVIAESLKKDFVRSKDKWVEEIYSKVLSS